MAKRTTKRKTTSKKKAKVRTTAIQATSMQPLDTAVRGVGQLQDMEPGDLELPVLHLYQDVGKESESYGDHDKGTWVNSQTQEPVDVIDQVIVPVMAYKQIEVWYHRDSRAGSGWIGAYPTMTDVPDQFQEDTDNYTVYQVINYLVLVEGQEELPMVMKFQSTMYRAGRSLATMERARAAARKPLGAYHLRTTERSNEKGKWLVPVIKPAGDASEELRDMAELFAAAFANVEVKVHHPEEKESARVDDGIPI